jgi:hypothetical protein
MICMEIDVFSTKNFLLIITNHQFICGAVRDELFTCSYNVVKISDKVTNLGLVFDDRDFSWVSQVNQIIRRVFPTRNQYFPHILIFYMWQVKTKSKSSLKFKMAAKYIMSSKLYFNEIRKFIRAHF